MSCLINSLLIVLQLSDNITYWANNSYPIAFQNHHAAFIITGERIYINGYGTGGINGNGYVFHEIFLFTPNNIFCCSWIMPHSSYSALTKNVDLMIPEILGIMLSRLSLSQVDQCHLFL